MASITDGSRPFIAQCWQRVRHRVAPSTVRVATRRLGDVAPQFSHRWPGASPHTVAPYRDTFKVLFGYLHDQTGKLPSQLDLPDLDTATVGRFLIYLQEIRRNPAATRNNRLAAIHSLFRYAALRAPEHLHLISRVLAIQTKRTTTTVVTYLISTEQRPQ